MKRATYVAEPEVFVRHTAQREFIGPGTVCLSTGDILMAAPWGRPPTNFEQLAARHSTPMLYRSTDGGRSWLEQGHMPMEWALPGMVSDGGISFLRLQDGRLAFLAHRHVDGLHGGGLPVISFSADDGQSWTPARLVGEPEGVWYVMNDRLVQLASGRLVVPVSHMPSGMGTYEGDRNLGLCFFSDDSGATWGRSRLPADLADGRGMAEPCVAEVRAKFGGESSKLIMLARTGSGCHHRAWSHDEGETWSQPEPTSLTAACSPLTLRSLPDGRLILLYNHAVPLGPDAFFPRTPLVYTVSSDAGCTWSAPVLVDDDGAVMQDRQNIYPSICFTDEGMLIVWSTHAADPTGSFTNGGAEGWRFGGGKRCIAEYPDVGRRTPAAVEVPQ